ncbi:OsWAK receptor-like protein kinase [Musa troglodytarum]|uniref:OsWAK receptor-like protein kinase n=1 Tax=Musa troglodytarum TaxID=320322 RepID=A0A9E7F797_9LILI|nr:OsWAK receptor-like protein kinase [Musa troglodytarum]
MFRSPNNLWDDHFMTEVSDFGASRFILLDQTHIITATQGTFGYLDAEYYQTSQLMKNNDVYSFRVILLVLLIGKNLSFPQNKQNVSMYFLAMRETLVSVESRILMMKSIGEIFVLIYFVEISVQE